jgi:predicted RNase H-like nuclease (RuvC/YqgF family)
MYLGIGFLIASLFGIALMPLVHGRAVRLTMRRLEAATPLSMAEIQADKDQLRAEFAMSTRRLEMSVEHMKAKTTSQLAELGKKTDAINRLKIELGDKTSTIFALEAHEKALKDQLKTTEQEYTVKTADLREAERLLADRQAELHKLSANLDEKSVTSDSQRIEIVALRTQIETLKDRVGDFEKEVKLTEDRLQREQREARTASQELTEERTKVENLASRVAELERQLIVQTTEAEILGRRVQELEARAAEQSRLIGEREHDAEQLRAQIAAARATETHLRAELTETEQRHIEATENLRAEQALREKELTQAQAQRTMLEGEIAAMKREAEASWVAERVENALLRERINDVAAEVARLTVVLEGPESPIEAILAGEPSLNIANGGTSSGELMAKTIAGVQEAKGNLAERMRALQTRASRVSPAT